MRSVLTTERTLVAGPALRTGPRAAYRGVVHGSGEPHLVRTELAGPETKGAARDGQAIACFVHLTDLHVTDVQSPARFEFVNREWGDPRFRELLTMQRPHETLNTYAIEAMVRAINGVETGPLTGASPSLVAVTGDGIDNTQHNELANLVALLDGGDVRPDSGAPGYDGVQRVDWRGEIYWKPDGPEDGDLFQSGLGFPRQPGLLERAMLPFACEGLRLPWLRCWGNHEQHCQGVGLVTPELARWMVGSRKPIAMPPGIDPDAAVETFVQGAERFTTGAYLEVAPDAGRRPIGRADMLPESTCYVRDEGLVRFITLDTVCDAGGADGTVEPEQLHWLERRLEEAHSTFRTRDGSLVRSRGQDRYVVLLSHHGYGTLSNPRCGQHADDLLALLSRFQNVILWLNGHIHANRITPRRTFWEVTTSALVDWPCQSRLVEIYRTAGGDLAIGCTMLDHDGEGLAGLHRELAANVPGNGFDSWRPGEASDRNAILLLLAPF